MTGGPRLLDRPAVARPVASPVDDRAAALERGGGPRRRRPLRQAQPPLDARGPPPVDRHLLGAAPVVCAAPVVGGAEGEHGAVEERLGLQAAFH
eukprot:6140265-Prymnesium_polylepis.1